MYSTLEKTILLSSVGFFQNLPAQTLSRIALIAEELRYEVGTELFKTGDYGDSLYVIASGEVRIHRERVTLAVLGTGESFGEMALLDDLPRSADATINDDAILFRIRQEEFEELMSTNLDVMRGIIRLLAARLRTANADLTKLSAHRRQQSEPGSKNR